jgi:phage gp45-like
MSADRNLLTRLLHAVGVGRITAVDDTGVVQMLQVSERPGPDGAAGVTDKVRRITQFGFTSNPPLQTEVVLLRLWGNRTLTLAIATNNQPTRLKNLQTGDSALYDQRGAYLWLTPAGLVIDGAGLPLTIQNVGTATINGALRVTEEVTANYGGADEVKVSQHRHSAVQAGAAQSGPPVPD